MRFTVKNKTRQISLAGSQYTPKLNLPGWPNQSAFYLLFGKHGQINPIKQQ